MADSVEQLYKAQDLQEKLYPITKENAVKDNSNVSLDTKLTSINTSISNKVDKVTGKGLSTNDYTSAEKTKLASIEDGAQVNIIESIELNGESQPIENKTAKIDISSVLENLTSGSSLKLYAQETLADQEFLYRESPTQEDGYAKIKSLYGNTLVWNQLIQNGNFADTSKWSTESGATLSISNNIATVSSTTANNGMRQYFPNPLTVGHKYLIKAEFNVPTEYRCVIGTAANQGVQTDKLISTPNTWTEVSGIVTCTVATTSFYCFVRGTTYENVKIRNVMCFDLTQMGLDITDPSEFTSLFSKPYYDYCQGAMLSFGGRNVKFNQIARPLEDTTYWAIRSDTGTGNISSGVANITATKAYASLAQVVAYRSNIIGSHKYLITCNVKGSRTVNFRNVIARSQSSYSYGNSLTLTTSYQKYTRLYTAENDTNYGVIFECSDSQSGDVINIKDVQIIDLTEMFGAGNEPSAEGFKELFPNDYYEYTTGKYMNIGQPVSLKTTGENLIDFSALQIGKNWTKSSAVDRAIIEFAVEENKEYTISFDYSSNISNAILVFRTGWNTGQISNSDISVAKEYTFTTPSNCKVLCVQFNARTSGFVLSQSDFFGNWLCALSSTFSAFPIPLDEFPNGMDGIGDVRDEKDETGYKKKIGFVVVDGSEDEYWGFQSGTPNQCYHRMVVSTNLNNPQSISNYANRVTTYAGLTGISYIIYSGELRISDMNGAITDVASLRAWLQAHPLVVAYALQEPLENYSVVDLGTLNWHTGGTSTSGIVRMGSSDLRSVIKKPSAGNVPAKILCNIYETKSADNTYTKNGAISLDTAGDVLVYDSNYNTSDKVSAFKQAMQGVYLLYEKENPQGFTNAEMKYSSYAGGTEQILPENSSIPTTAPIVADIEYSYDFKAVDRIIGMLNSVAQNETSPSTHNYSVGDYLVYNYQLYKVIASISTGASLTVGTNIQATTIMNELASLS